MLGVYLLDLHPWTSTSVAACAWPNTTCKRTAGPQQRNMCAYSSSSAVPRPLRCETAMLERGSGAGRRSDGMEAEIGGWRTLRAQETILAGFLGDEKMSILRTNALVGYATYTRSSWPQSIAIFFSIDGMKLLDSLLCEYSIDGSYIHFVIFILWRRH